MTKSCATDRQPGPAQSNPKMQLISTNSSTFKNTTKPLHATPLSEYSPSRLLQHTPLHIPPQVEMIVCRQKSREIDTDPQSKKNLTWTNDMDDYLLDCLLDQMEKGQKIGVHFTKAAYLTVAHLVSEKFCISCNSDNVKHRMKTLKKNYFGAKEILSRRYGSGFGFNQSTCMIEASASTWDSYIKDHPCASVYRCKVIRQWEKMDMIYGKDRASGDGEHAEWPNEQNHLCDNDENNIGDSCEQNGDDENAIDVDVDPEPASSSSKLKVYKESSKKRRRVADLLEEELLCSLREGMGKIAEAINPRNYTENELFEHIQKLSGMSARNKMKVYQSLAEDVNLARSFIGCSEEMHGLWMSTKFGNGIFDLL